MVSIELAEKDVATVVEILRSCLVDLKTERLGTDNRAFHASLMAREDVVAGLIRQLEGTVGVA